MEAIIMAAFSSPIMENNKINICIENGNKHLLYFLFILLFIHFTIILPSKHSPKNYELLGTSESVANQLRTINRQIILIERRKDTSYSPAVIENLDDKLNNLQSQQIQFEKEQMELAKQKVIDRNFSLPILNVSISESIIRTVYPGFILVGLCILLSKRKKFITLYGTLNDSEKEELDRPIWTAPMPLTLSAERLPAWVLKSILALTVHFVLL